MQPTSAEQPLAVATELVRRLREAGVRYGVYKNTRSVPAGVAGRSDLDLIVAAADMERFRAVLFDLKAIRGHCHGFCDNAVQEREDWFVPDFAQGDYIHLDVSRELVVGRKFSKRYVGLQYEDVTEWSTAAAPLPPIPMVSPKEEARIAILRSLFGLRLGRRRKWVRPGNACRALLEREMPNEGLTWQLEYRVGAQVISCPVRNIGGQIELESSALRRLKDAVRRGNGSGALAEAADFVAHQWRRLIYFGARKLSRFSPGVTATKRTVAPGGMTIALIGPDGSGKSSQAPLLAKLFQRKFRCATVYLGSGDGGWELRRWATRRYHRGRPPQRDKNPAARRRAGPKAMGMTHATVAALAGLATAIERYVSQHRARRLARSGAIVICDRWPQNLQPGLMDGPRHLPPRPSPIVRSLSAIERSLFRRMERHEPDLMIHMLIDFETSRARKPGDRETPDFEQRLSLMSEMRARNPKIMTVDARGSFEEVTRLLFQAFWVALWERSRPTRAADDYRHGTMAAVAA